MAGDWPEAWSGCRRYAEWADGTKGAMLFDHTRDPHELKNLADEPAQAGVVAEMKALLKQLPPQTPAQ